MEEMLGLFQGNRVRKLCVYKEDAGVTLGSEVLGSEVRV